MGYADMLSQNKLIIHWKKWINRNKSFKKDDILELETHLIDEIDYLTEKGGLTEQEAFYKAVDIIGERAELDEEFNKVKPLTARITYWLRTNSLQLMICLCLILFIAGFILGWYPTYKEITQIKNQLGYVQIFKGSFVPFKLINNELPHGINKPKIVWKNELRYNNEIPEYVNNLVTDSEGNIYLNANYKNKSILYSLSPDGKTKWMIENLEFENFTPVENGIMMNSWTKEGKLRIVYCDKNGQFKWSQKGSYSSIGPDGMVYAYNLNDKEFFSCDSKGKIRWIFKLPQIDENIELQKYFFDDKANIHLIFTYDKSNKTIIYTFSSEGKKLYEKELWINDYILNNCTFYGTSYYDDFLVFSNETFFYFNNNLKDNKTKASNNIGFNFRIAESNSFSKITSFTKEGYENWIIKRTRDEIYRIYDCTFGYNSNFYVIYSGCPIKGKGYIDLASSNYDPKQFRIYLESISEDSQTLFKNEIKSSYSGSLIDNENNLYIACGGYLNFEDRASLNSSKEIIAKYLDYEAEYKKSLSYEEIQKGLKDKRTIYCYYPDGKLKWQMEQPNPKWAYNSDLVLGPDASLYYIESGTNILYCIQDEGK
jgi:hypothetical protein